MVGCSVDSNVLYGVRRWDVVVKMAASGFAQWSKHATYEAIVSAWSNREMQEKAVKRDVDAVH